MTVTRIIDGLRQQVIVLLADLAARPWCLLCLIVAANAVALPYYNFHHDANLYGVQTLNRIYPDRFTGDLFFQFGSQDKYSLFSTLMAPLAACLGLPAAFFLVYLASNTLLLFALQRFIRALVKHPLISTLAVLFLAVTEVPFGGLRIFHVNEPFLTPRVAANALVLLSLERLLAGRGKQASLLVALALPLHPLMAFPGVLIVAGWLTVTHLRTRDLLAVLSVAALATSALLLDRPLASRLLGHMNDTWRDSVHRVNPYHFPLDWTAEDWLRIVVSLTVVLTAAWNLREQIATRRLLLVISGVAVVGTAGGVLVCFLPYALPLQGQPWRCLWPLELLLYPTGFLVAQRIWTARQFAGKWAALGLLAYLNDSDWTSPVLLLLLSTTALFGIAVWRGFCASPHIADWPARVGIFALGPSLALWTLIKIGLVICLRGQLEALLEPMEILTLATALIDPLCRLALVLLVMLASVRLIGMGWKFELGYVGISLAAALIFFALPQSRFYKDRYASHATDEYFVADFLAKHPSAATPTIYWPGGKSEYLWIDLRVCSYFHIHQVVGNLFSAGNAAEGRHRAQLTRSFELDYLRRHRLLCSERRFRDLFTLFEANGRESPPQRHDLLRLCREKQLDFVVLSQEFPGLSPVSNGRIFIYDCQAIRTHREEMYVWPEKPLGVASSVSR